MDPQEILLLTDARTHAATGTGRQIRENARLSVAEMATAIGTDRPTLSRWETGKRRPRGDAAVRWALILAELPARSGGGTPPAQAA